MAQNVPLNKGEVAIEPFFDAIQELLSGSAPSLALSVLNSTTIQAFIEPDDPQQTIAIEGRYRFNDATATRSHPGGAAGVYDVFATAADNDFTGPDPTIDVTDYDWSLDIRSGSTPSTPIWQKIGEVEWDGSKITRLIQLAGNRRDNAPISPTAPIASFTPLKVRGAPLQTAALATFEGSDGTALAQVTATGRVVGLDGLTTRSLPGTPTDGGFAATPPDGTIVVANGALFYRFGGNWLKSGQSPFLATADSPAAPSYAWVSDPGTGLFLASTGVLGFASEGVVTAELSTAGQLLLPAAGSTAGLLIGGDAKLYRSASSKLKTDGSLEVGAILTVDGTLLHTGGSVGFFGHSGASQPAARTLANWSGVTNSVRGIDRNAYTLQQLYDFVMTMASDLQSLGLFG